ncbi:MAG: hypothetical protein M3R61_10810 [Chloroflexota bacterium]|nr:hypothetical protein [Chloroflexota bacterium]
MNDRPYLSRIAILVLASMAVGCMLVAGVTLWLRPRWFDTHQEAIGYILDRHGIAYQQIEVMHVWPDTLDQDAYAADVVVLRPSASQAIGRIVCASGRSKCYLRVRVLGILHEPVPDLAAPSPWRNWLKRNLAQFAQPS